MPWRSEAAAIAQQARAVNGKVARMQPRHVEARRSCALTNSASISSSVQRPRVSDDAGHRRDSGDSNSGGTIEAGIKGQTGQTRDQVPSADRNEVCRNPGPAPMKMHRHGPALGRGEARRSPAPTAMRGTISRASGPPAARAAASATDGTPASAITTLGPRLLHVSLQAARIAERYIRARGTPMADAAATITGLAAFSSRCRDEAKLRRGNARPVERRRRSRPQYRPAPHALFRHPTPATIMA